MQKKEIYEEISIQAKVIAKLLEVLEKTVKDNLNLLQSENFKGLPIGQLNAIETKVNNLLNSELTESLKIEERKFTNLIKELKTI